ncbi:MAG: lipoprotein-releasing ABC transporter permease subunit [Alphaproteobacteria bacterium]|nr:lipoprotein-releasing ABC transporter permease subunit [Alphaproteobacteria bacterium]
MSTAPFAAFEWLLAGRYLRARKKERTVSVISVISFLGIMLGVATLIIVMSVMNGFRQELLSKILGLNGHITAIAYDGAMPDYDDVTASIRRIPGVRRAAPIVDGQVMVRGDGGTTGAMVRGLKKADLATLDVVAKTLSPGSLDAFQGGDAIIIGTRLADQMGLRDAGGTLIPDARLTLIGADGPVTAVGPTTRRKTYSIVGTFNIGMSEYDSLIIFMPLEQAQLYFRKEGTATAVEAMVDAPDRVGDWVPAFRDATPPGTRIQTWQQTNESFFTAIQVERTVMFLILTLIILVAALNIISGMIMLVKDKGGDIAILRTMGATRGTIMRVFLIAGSSIGIVGTIAGVGLGVLFAANIETIRQFVSGLVGVQLFDPLIYFLSRLPAVVDTGDVITIGCLALCLSFVATLYPAWRAARIDPVEALRYE